ncbi:uncharacterized protein LOC125191076 [Salvia hispanica]|uniref:uncharacterized protein LOC125191076 n=1 Tax=Salvia hispanica TaxID=49212 RepID=UPI002009A267|nr:uncharacterized protein LOC125191076 [Salvia hispanica]
MRKKNKKPTYFPEAVWNEYREAWNTADAIKASKRCSNNRGKEKALPTHANGCVAFDVTAKKMAKENQGKLPPFWDLFLKTHRLKDSHKLCSQQAKEIEGAAG